MQSSTERAHRKSRRGAVRGMVIYGLCQGASAAVLICVCLIPGIPRWAVILFGVLAGLDLVLILPGLWALKQRFQEIEGGELDAAGKY